MPLKLEWKNALLEYLNAPCEDDLNTPVIYTRNTRSQALKDLGNIFLYAMAEVGRASIPYLKRMLINFIEKDNDNNFNRRLDAIESKASTPTFIAAKSSKSKGEKLTDTNTNKLFKFKKKSDKLKSFILANMLMLYFAADQEEGKKIIINKCYDLLVIDEAFALYSKNDDFKVSLKNLVISLINQTNTYAEAYLKFKSSSVIKHLGFYNKDKRYFAETFFTDSCSYAKLIELENYQLDRAKAKAFYTKVQGYKQSGASLQIDACANILYITSAIFLLSMAMGIYDYPVVGFVSATVSGFAFAAYLKEFLWEATAATGAFAKDYTNKTYSLLEFKLVDNKIKDILELKVESRIPQEAAPDRSVAPLPLSWQKIRRKHITPATPTANEATLSNSVETSLSEQKTFADTNGNIYYRLANNSFFRFNARELNQNRESINNPKLSLASIMQNILEKSVAIGSPDSQSDGIKYVNPSEKKPDAKKYPLKFKFKGAPYGSLRIALATRSSRPEETELLKSETTINSPGLLYRH